MLVNYLEPQWNCESWIQTRNREHSLSMWKICFLKSVGWSGNAQLLLHNISVCRHISVLHLQLFAALSLPPMPLHDSQQPLSNWLGNTHRSLTGLLACVTESFDPFVAFTKSFSLIFLVSVVRISEKKIFSPRQDVPELNLSLYFSCANLKINVKWIKLGTTSFIQTAAGNCFIKQSYLFLFSKCIYCKRHVWFTFTFDIAPFLRLDCLFKQFKWCWSVLSVERRAVQETLTELAEIDPSPIINNNPPQFLLRLSDVCISFVFLIGEVWLNPAPSVIWH